MKRRQPLRGEVWLIELDPTIGREIQKTRPCLVISADGMNRHLDTMTIMPMTSASRAAPFRVPVRFDGKDGFLLAEQIRTVDRHRLRKHLGELPQPVVNAALGILREMFEE